jgi:hypothetical protein
MKEGYGIILNPHWSYPGGMYSFAPFLTECTSSNVTTEGGLEDALHQLELFWLIHNGARLRRQHMGDGSESACLREEFGVYCMALVDTLETALIYQILYGGYESEKVHRETLSASDGARCRSGDGYVAASLRSTA